MLNPKKEIKKMKKFILSLGLIAMAFGLTNCTKNEEVNPVVETKGDFAIYATVTRTANDGLNTVWSAKDEINVFHAIGETTDYVNDTPYTNNVAYPFVCDDATVGRFLSSRAVTLDVAEEYDWYAFYPYSSYIKTPANDNAGYTYIGSKAGSAQVQNGNNSMAHIAGENYPMAGYAVAVPGDSAPHLTFNHLSSLIEVEVANKLAEAITISEIQFIAEENIVGTYYINFANKENLNFTPSGANYVSNTAILTVNDGAEIAAGASAKFYAAVKPFVAKNGSDLTIKVSASSATGLGTHEKDITLTNDVTFSAGKIKNVKVDYTTVIEAPEVENGLLVDVLTRATTGIATNSSNYATWKDKRVTSAAVYAGNSAGSNDAIQLRNQNPSGIVTTASGGKIKKVVVEWNTNTTNTRTLTVYGKNMSYTSSADLYDNNAKGVSLGTIVCGTSTELVINGDYTYIGLQANGAMYLDKITLYWEDDGLTSQTLSFPVSSYTITEGDSFTAPTVSGAKTTVSYSSSDTGVATVDVNTGAVTVVGTGLTTITATAIEADGYRAAEASYTLTVNPKVTEDSAAYVKVTSQLSDWSGKYLIVWGTEAHATVSGKDLAKTINVTITDNKILSTSVVDAAAVTIATSGSSYSLKLPNGKYLSMSTNGNQVSEAAAAFALTFTWKSSGVEIVGKDSAGNSRYLLQNGTYYRAYKAVGSYKLPTLYKLEE